MNRHQRRAFERQFAAIINPAIDAEARAFGSAGDRIHAAARAMRDRGELKSLDGIRSLADMVNTAMDAAVHGILRRTGSRLGALIGDDFDAIMPELAQRMRASLMNAAKGTPIGKVFDVLAEAERMTETMGQIDDDFESLFSEL